LWSPEEKQRIVAEALRPGASVAEIARRHGMNANLVFTWRRASRGSLASPGASNSLVSDPQPVMDPPAFIPIGVFAAAGDVDRATTGDILPTVTASTAPRRADAPRSGMIEIDLADGTRLRVDAFVNERALRRVLTVLRAS
jgi:transposase